MQTAWQHDKLCREEGGSVQNYMFNEAKLDFILQQKHPLCIHKSSIAATVSLYTFVNKRNRCTEDTVALTYHSSSLTKHVVEPPEVDQKITKSLSQLIVNPT